MTGQESSPGTDPAGAADGLARAWSGWLGPWGEARVDAAQRSVLFLDVLRRCGDEHLEHMAKPVPHPLAFEGRLVVDGRTLARPVDHGPVAIAPPAGVGVDPRERPFVGVDSPAGHGPEQAARIARRIGEPCGRIATQVGREPERKEEALGPIRRVVRAVGEPQGERAARLARIEALFGAQDAGAPRARRVQGGKR